MVSDGSPSANSKPDGSDSELDESREHSISSDLEDDASASTKAVATPGATSPRNAGMQQGTPMSDALADRIAAKLAEIQAATDIEAAVKARDAERTSLAERIASQIGSRLAEAAAEESEEEAERVGERAAVRPAPPGGCRTRSAQWVAELREAQARRGFGGASPGGRPADASRGVWSGQPGDALLGRGGEGPRFQSALAALVAVTQQFARSREPGDPSVDELLTRLALACGASGRPRRAEAADEQVPTVALQNLVNAPKRSDVWFV